MDFLYNLDTYKNSWREIMSKSHLMLNRKFWPMYWTQFFGAFNDNVFKNFLVLLITFKAYSLGAVDAKQMVALCGGIFILPFFLFSTLAGQLADKFSKSKMIYWVKVWELLAMVIAAIGFYKEDIRLLLFTLFFMGLQSAFFGPIKYAVLPEFVDEDEVLAANAYVKFGTFIAILLGTGLGGVLAGIDSMTVINVSVISFAILGILASMMNPKLPPMDPNLKINYNLITMTYRLIRDSHKDRELMFSIQANSWFWFLGAAVLTIIPIYVKDLIHGNTDVATLFMATFSVGIAIGAILCEMISRNGHIEKSVIPYGCLGMSVFMLDLYFIGTPSFPFESATIMNLLKDWTGIRIIFDFTMFSMCAGFFTVPLNTIMVTKCAPDKRSQTVAANNILNALYMVISSVFLIVLFGRNMSLANIFLILCIMNFVVAMFSYQIFAPAFWRMTLLGIAKFFYRFSVHGKEHIPAKGPALVICNHVSFVDWMFIGGVIKQPARFVMHYVFFKMPIINKFFFDTNSIAIAGFKEDENILKRSFEEIKEALDKGDIVVYFPEGEITHDGEMTNFKKGLQKILEENKVPVIPMSINGMYGSFFSRKHGKAMTKPFRTFYPKIHLHIGDMIHPHSDVSVDKMEQIIRDLNQKPIF
jgi:1-acyl-sn-glycerol-3-phosphate acyltransferase